MCLYGLSFVLWCPLRLAHKTMFGSSLSPVVCRKVHVLLCYIFFCACMFAYSDVQHFVLSNISTYWVQCCDVHYDFRIKTMFGSSLLPVFCRRAHVLFTLFVFVCVQWCPTRIFVLFVFVLCLMYPTIPVFPDFPFGFLSILRTERIRIRARKNMK